MKKINKIRKMQAFRMRIEAINALKQLTKKVNNQSVIPITMTGLLELLILDASKKEPNVILNMITKDKT